MGRVHAQVVRPRCWDGLRRHLRNVECPMKTPPSRQQAHWQLAESLFADRPDPLYLLFTPLDAAHSTALVYPSCAGNYQYYSEVSQPKNAYGVKGNKAKGRATTADKGQGLNVLLVNGCVGRHQTTQRCSTEQSVIAAWFNCWAGQPGICFDRTNRRPSECTPRSLSVAATTPSTIELNHPHPLCQRRAAGTSRWSRCHLGCGSAGASFTAASRCVCSSSWVYGHGLSVCTRVVGVQLPAMPTANIPCTLCMPWARVPPLPPPAVGLLNRVFLRRGHQRAHQRVRDDAVRQGAARGASAVGHMLARPLLLVLLLRPVQARTACCCCAAAHLSLAYTWMYADLPLLVCIHA